MRAGFGQDNRVYFKGAIDLVTDIDRKSEDFLVNEIRHRFPDSSIIAEEGGSRPGQGNALWLIDPLDGTVNFAHGVPFFSVSIAYAEDGAVKLGAVYDPLLDECFSAELGKGARLNGRPIHVSGEQELVRCLLVTGFPYDIQENPRNNLELYARFTMLTQGVRRLGSAALDLSYVAAGRLDGYWELELMPYDVAAGSLIAHEAGATVTSVWGDPNYLTTPCSILAATPKIYPIMQKIISESRAET